jgi:hypothetical protein
MKKIKISIEMDECETIKRFLYIKRVRKIYYDALDKSLEKYPINNPFDAVPFEDPRVFEFISEEDYINVLETLHDVRIIYR